MDTLRSCSSNHLNSRRWTASEMLDFSTNSVSTHLKPIPDRWRHHQSTELP